MLANLPNLLWLDYSYVNPLSWPVQQPAVQPLTFRKLEKVNLWPVAVGYYFPAPPGNLPPEIETTRRKVDAAQLKPPLTAPNIEEITVACLESGGLWALDEVQDGSSILTSLKLLVTNVPAATLRKLFRIPARLQHFHWQRYSFVCATDLNNPWNHCVVARPHDLQEALQSVSQSLERLSLEMVEQHRCQQHEYEALDPSMFENLISLSNRT
jgi:hypothetical protein